MLMPRMYDPTPPQPHHHPIHLSYEVPTLGAQDPVLLILCIVLCDPVAVTLNELALADLEVSEYPGLAFCALDG